MKKTYLLIGLLIVLTLSACQKPVASIMPGDKNVMQTQEAMTPPQQTMEEPVMQNPRLLAGTTTQYLKFDKTDYDQARMDNKIIVLNFYANWCPVCKAEQSEIFAAFNEMNYPNVVAFRVNYKDTETDSDEEQLAKDFGITVQHTKVILKNGQKVLKSLESWDKARYLTEVGAVA